MINMLIHRMMSSATNSFSVNFSNLLISLLTVVLLSACGGGYAPKDPFDSSDDEDDRLDNPPLQTIVPVVSLTDVQILEGSNGETQGVVAVTIDPVAENEFTLPLSISAENTASEADFSLSITELTVPANTEIVVIPFTVTGDTEVEGNESFTVLANEVPGINIDKNNGIVTIIDDDVPTFSATGINLIEGETGTVTVSLSAAYSEPITVDYNAVNDTATITQDFRLVANSLTFAPGETSQTIIVIAVQDSEDEGPERFSIEFNNAADTVILTPSITINIIDDDTPNPSIFIDSRDVRISEGSEPEGVYSLPVNLSAPASIEGTVDYTVTPNANNNNYVAFNGSLTFPAGTSNQNINIPLNGNTRDQFDSTLAIVFSNPSNLLLPISSPTIITIEDDDELPVLNIADASFEEGNEGDNHFVTFTASLSEPSGKQVSIDYNTLNDSAIAGSDFESTQGRIAFAAGTNTPQIIQVPIIENNVDENNRDFLLVFSALNNVRLNNTVIRGTIIDDDGSPALTITNADYQEGDAINSIAIPVTLQPASGLEITVDYAVSNGSAILGEDYNTAQTSGTLTFSAGSTEENIIIDLLGDSFDDDDRAFSISLSNSSFADINGASATFTLLDDDPQPDLVVQDITIQEDVNNPASVAFTVTPSTPSKKQITVNYATSANSLDPNPALTGRDYTAVSGTLAIPPEQPNATINLTLVNNALDQSDRSFLLNFGSPSNANLPDNTAIITLEDDDPEPSITFTANPSILEGDDPNTRNDLEFEVALSAPSGKPVSFSYSTQDGSAQAGIDYQAQNGVETFNTNGDPISIAVPIESNLINQDDRSFTLELSNPQNATLGQTSATGEIIDDDGAPTLSVLDATFIEGNSSNEQNVLVQLSAPSGLDVTVEYSIINGSAIAGEDFTATATGTLSFLAAQQDTLATIPVSVLGDLQDDNNRSFTVFLSNASSANIADNEAVITIEDDDADPQIEFTDLAFVEGSSPQATFEITVNPPSKRAISFDFTTNTDNAAPYPAQDPLDYSSRSDSVALAANTTTHQITIPINDNTLDQFERTFLLEFSNPNNATFPETSAVISIEDNDAEPTISIANASVLEGGPADSNALNFIATLSTPSGKPVSFNYTTADGTATQPTDYTAQSGTASFNSNGDPVTISIPVIGNDIDQVNRSLSLELSAPNNATLNTPSASGEIRDDDGEPTLEIFSTSLIEGNTENAQQISVSLLPASGLEVTVDYVITDGTALNGEDFSAATTGSLTFPANLGVTEQFIDLSILGDTLDDDDRTLSIQLSSATNALIGNDTATITIQDDDATPSLIVSSSTLPVTEGSDNSTLANFAVSLSTASKRSPSVSYTTANGSAIAGEDYEATSGTLVFDDPLELTRTISVPVIGDLLDDDNRSFTLNFSNGQRLTIGNSTGTIEIIDDDLPPTVSIVDADTTEGDAGTQTVPVTINLSSPSRKTITVDLATADGSAVAGEDYVATSGTVIVNPNTTSTTTPVTIINNLYDEPSRSFAVTLSNASEATIDTNADTATVIINDNDAAPTISVADFSVSEVSNFAELVLATLAPTKFPVSLSFSTTSLTATAPEDYVAAVNVSPVFSSFDPQNPQPATATVQVALQDNPYDQPDRNFRIDFSNIVNTSLSQPSVEVTIQDDDTAPTLEVSATPVDIVEGNDSTTLATFTVNLSEGTLRTATVDFTTTNNSAIAGEDYVAASGTLTFDDVNTVSQQITIPINGDFLDDDDRNFYLDFSNASNLSLDNTRGTVQILDDDAEPTLTVSTTAVEVTEGNDASTIAEFTVSLSNGSNRTPQVAYATADGDALAGEDFVTTSGTLVFDDPNNLTQTISVPINGDVLDDDDVRSFSLNFSSPVGLALDNTTGTININDDDLPPVISIGSNSLTEGDSGTLQAPLTLTLSSVSKRGITVDYATSDNSALAGIDYVASIGSAAIQPNTLTATINTNIINNLMDEPNRSYNVAISNPVNATLDTNNDVGQVTIEDNDDVPTITISDFSVSESAGFANLVLTTDNPTRQSVAMLYSTVALSAVAGEDFTAAINVPVVLDAYDPQNPQPQTTTIQIPLIGNNFDENDRSFRIDFDQVLNASLSQSSVTVTITDDDAEPTLTIDQTPVTVTEGNDSSTTATVNLTLSEWSKKSPSVNFATVNGTAIAGEDFVATSGTLTFDDQNNLTLPITLTINGDLMDDEDRSLTISLAGNDLQLPVNSATVIIEDDDAEPEVSLSGTTVTEGDTGTETATLTVALNTPSKRSVTVNYATSNGTAIAGIDYTAASGSVTIAAETTSQTFTVTTLNNVWDEPNRSFTATISNPQSAQLAPEQNIASVNITDNDNPPQITIADFSVSESAGTADLVLTPDNPTRFPITLDYSTRAITAIAPDDFTAATNVPVTLNAFDPQNPQTQTATIQIPLQDNPYDEDSRTFAIDLNNIAMASLSQASVIVTMTDDDLPPALNVSATPLLVTEGDDNSTQATFFVSLSEFSRKTPSVSFTTADGSALAGEDYVSTSGSVTFDDQNNLTRDITVNINGDLYDDEDRSFNLNFSGDSQLVTIANSTGTITIEDDDATPSIIVSSTPLQVTEGNDNTTRADFVVSLSAGSKLTPTVAFTTTDNTALAGEDYLATSGTLTFSDLINLDQTISVTINGDTLDDDDREFNLQFSSPTNASLSNSTATIQIQDDDAEPTVRIDDTSITEQDSGTTAAPLTLTLSSISKKSILVDWSTSDGSAIAGQDYESASSTTTIPANTLSEQFTVNIINNNTDEPDRSFLVELGNIQNASIEPDTGPATVTIEDDDAPSSITVTDFSVSESDGFATLTLTTDTPTEQVISIDYATAAGTALPGQDYTEVSSGQLVIPAYDPQNPAPQTGTIQIELLPNNFDEDDRSFGINFSNIVNTELSQSSVTVTITDDDDQPTLTFDTSTLQFTEIDDNTGSASFEVTLSEFSRKSPQVSFSTTDGTAIAGEDFTSTSNTFVFDDQNDLTRTVSIPINGDLLNDNDRSFTVDFSGAQDLTLAATSRTIQIIDDDPEPALAIAMNTAITEGNSNQDVTVTVNLTPASNLTVNTDYASSSDPQNGGAVDGVDYNAVSGSLTFAPGETSKTFSVTVLGNTVDNADRTFTLATSNESGATAATTVNATILDDDATPSISIADVQVNEGDDNSTRATLTLQLDNPVGSGQVITVDYATADGSAIAGTDYSSASGTVTIPANNPTATIDVIILGNTTAESNRAFSVNFSNSANADLNNSTATVTILDDDAGATPGLASRPSNTSCVASARPVSNSSVQATRVFSNVEMSYPVQLIQSPLDTNRWYVVEQDNGRLVTFEADGSNRSVSLSVPVNPGGDEGGFLGVAFHPDFANNGYIFVSSTDMVELSDEVTDFTSLIDRYTSNDNGLTFDPATRKTILRLRQPYYNHNGGTIRFGPDGYLYFGMGDGGDSYDPENRSQNTKNLFGTMMRLDINTTEPYAIPTSNPFYGNDLCDSGTGADATEDCPEIYAWGLRNPWQFHFDEPTQTLWAGDVGQITLEEIDLIELGGNYGWNIYEGNWCIKENEEVNECNKPNLIRPVVDLDRNTGTYSITGGLVYRGSELSGFEGTYIFGDLSGRLFYIGLDDNNQPSVESLMNTSNYVVSFTQDHEGEVYYVDVYTSSIYKLEPAGDPPVDTFPYRLSETGCFDTVAQTPTSGLVPFDLNQKLWSDGADKDRYMALPDDTYISIDANNDWIFPDGTVLVKNFRLNGNLFETRLLMKHTDGWGGYSYEWNQAGTDADYVAGGKTTDVEGQSWTYPSSTQCFKCHTSAANGPLGPETPALNGDFTYPSTSITANQIFTLEHINMFAADVPEPETLPSIPELNDESASLEDRVKGYLHVNCSGCHQPGTPVQSTMDLRYQIPLSSMNICNVDPINTFDIPGAKLIAPGDTDASTIIYRMNRRDIAQMPPLGTDIVDAEAMTIISRWVNTMGACP